jgi:hypothetical protein
MTSIQTLEKDQYTVQDKEDYHQIEYIGNWTHMDKGGSYAHTNQDTARYAFWGYGIQIRTELMSHHSAYKIFIDGKFIESVNVKNPINTSHNLTYSNMELSTGNHILELIPDGGYFVLNTLTIHYYVDPTPDIPYICDTVYIVDTLYIVDMIHIIDTVYLKPKIFVKVDSIIYDLN